MIERLYQAEPTLRPRLCRVGETRGLSTMRKADLQLLAAAKGIDVIGLSVNLMRLKLDGWEATQLSGSISSYPSVEPPIETSAMLVLSDDDDD